VSKKKPSQGIQIALIVAGLLAVAALGYLFVISPKRAETKRIEEQIASIEAQIAANRTAADAAAAPAPEPVDVSELFRLSKAMPDRADMAEVILELNRIARDTGITFQSITPAAASEGAGFQTLPIALAFEGDFYGLSDYLFRLRNLVAVRDGKVQANGRLFNVQSITFGEAEHGFPQVKATLTVNAFVFGAGDPAATQAAPPAAPPTEEAPAEGGEEQPADPSATPPAASAAPEAGATS
jgi:Tfp pilus assembly protein PilO